MKEINIEKLVMDSVITEALHYALIQAISEAIDYKEIAEEIVSRVSITDIVCDNIGCPF